MTKSSEIRQRATARNACGELVRFLIELLARHFEVRIDRDGERLS